MKNKMEMHEVFRALGTEMAYQENKWKEQSHFSVSEYLIYMQHYLDKAFEAISTEDCINSCDTTLNQIRKIGALAVACGQQHGMPCRVGFENRYNFTRGDIILTSNKYGEPDSSLYLCICSDEFEAIFVESVIKDSMLVSEYRNMIAMSNNEPLPFEYKKMSIDDVKRSLQPTTKVNWDEGEE